MAIPESFIASAAQQLNSGAHHFRIGGLPNIRQRLTGRRPTTRSTFDGRTTFPTYAFHVSGRQELQFNIGTEGTLENPELRYGVAFSLQLGRNLPTIEPLLPKISRFNEFSRLYPERFENIKAWYWRGDERSADYPPTPIRPEWVVPPTFIFFGQRQPIDVLDYDAILTLFDRLLPLYEYTEGGDGAQPIETPIDKMFEFRPRFTPRQRQAIASLAERHLDIDLRHNVIQETLYHQLVSRHGKKNVGAEMPNGVGALMDVAVRTDEGLWIYEIKTGASARGCIREAIGQLLEYAFGPEHPRPPSWSSLEKAPSIKPRRPISYDLITGFLFRSATSKF